MPASEHDLNRGGNGGGMIAGVAYRTAMGGHGRSDEGRRVIRRGHVDPYPLTVRPLAAAPSAAPVVDLRATAGGPTRSTARRRRLGARRRLPRRFVPAAGDAVVRETIKRVRPPPRRRPRPARARPRRARRRAAGRVLRLVADGGGGDDDRDPRHRRHGGAAARPQVGRARRRPRRRHRRLRPPRRVPRRRLRDRAQRVADQRVG